MIEIDVPNVKEFNTTNVSRLAASFKDLGTYDQVADWDRRAVTEIEAMHLAIQTVTNKQQSLSQALLIEKDQYESKSFLSKLFDSRTEKNRLQLEQTRLETEKANIENLIDQVEAASVFTPDDPADLKELLKECRQKKKELQTEKKALNAEMTAIRTEARHKTVSTMPGSFGKWDRRAIRFSKESALRPHETEKAALERQLIQIDRLVIWLERFK